MSNQEQGDWGGFFGYFGAIPFILPGRDLFSEIAYGKFSRDPNEALIANFHDGGTFIDLGGGSGNYTLLMASKFNGRFVNVDLSTQMLSVFRAASRLRGVAKKVETIRAAAEKSTLPDECADLVFSSHLVHEVHKPIELVLEKYRLCKSGGVAITIDFKDTPKNRKMLSHHSDYCNGPMAPDELMWMLKQVGFINVEFYNSKRRMMIICRKP